MLNWFSKKSSAEVAPELVSLMEKLNLDKLPRHVALIMDGNGRWAQKKGLPRSFGHKAGAEKLKTIVRFASDIGISAITAYAFSTENWKRPQNEVDILMSLFSSYLTNEVEELHQNQVRIMFSGDLSRLAKPLEQKMLDAAQYTRNNQGLTLNLAVNYGGRAELVRAFRSLADKIATGELKSDDIGEDIITEYLYTASLPDPELLIRPSGDLRLSNFLLWQTAYTELWFTPLNWPDFTPQVLVQALLDFQARDRRFGGLKK
ncbi:undecaprenyl diphosphate synthase [Sporomusaceae bacterium BoRhaA]|nr:isoprenyl transferase [Pelorhabdus rhamnosifermentans]MBU2701976.1 undecaprenyl diphosphate synthase [Pelorhabdus rhamnosifermentans]